MIIINFKRKIYIIIRTLFGHKYITAYVGVCFFFNLAKPYILGVIHL